MFGTVFFWSVWGQRIPIPVRAAYWIKIQVQMIWTSCMIRFSDQISFYFFCNLYFLVFLSIGQHLQYMYPQSNKHAWRCDHRFSTRLLIVLLTGCNGVHQLRYGCKRLAFRYWPASLEPVVTVLSVAIMDHCCCCWSICGESELPQVNGFEFSPAPDLTFVNYLE